jgi:hypothetical protein
MEFLLSLPTNLFLGHHNKGILREAMVGTWPDVLHTRPKVGGMQHCFTRQMVHTIPQIMNLFQDPLVVQLGFADYDALIEFIEKFRFGLTPTEWAPADLHCIVSLEVWLRTNRFWKQ